MNIFFIFTISLIIPFIAVILEIYPRFRNKEFGVDIWTHLLYLKEYKKQKGIPKKIENGFLVTGIYDYPPAFISILSKFPYKLVEKYEFLFSPFFDAIHQILIFYITFYLTQNIYISLLTQLLYTLTPIIILENSSATPRSLGYTLFTVVMLGLFVFQLENNYLYLLGSVFLGSLIFLSHRFTTQGYLLFSIFFSFYYMNILFIGAFLLSFICALIISKGFYMKVLKGHIGNLKFWYLNIHNRFAHQVKGNYNKHKTKDFIFKLYNQFLKFPPFVLAITNPWTIAVFYYFIFFKSIDPILNFLILWVIISYVLALITIWIPVLRFLGEGQRYLELSAFPSAYIASLLLFKLSNTQYKDVIFVIYIIVGILCLTTILVIQKKGMINDTLRTVTPSLSNMFKYLKSLKKKPKLLCIPHQITTNVIYHTRCPVFVNADYTNINKISEVYPVLKKPIKQIMENYNLDNILLNTEYANIEDLKIKKYKIIKQFNNYVLIKCL